MNKEVLKDHIRFWRAITKAEETKILISKAEGYNQILETIEKIIVNRRSSLLGELKKRFGVSRFDTARREFLETFSTLQKSVQSHHSKLSISKTEESKHNSIYIDQLGAQIASVERILDEVQKKTTEFKQLPFSPEISEKALRKVASAAKIHKILMIPIELDCSLVRFFLRWRFRRVSVTSKLLTDDINKCFAKFQKTMLILLNRRILNKIASHFHSFTQRCAAFDYQNSSEYKNLLKNKKAIQVLKVAIKSASKGKKLGKASAFSRWKVAVKKDIKREFSRKRAMVLLVT